MEIINKNNILTIREKDEIILILEGM